MVEKDASAGKKLYTRKQKQMVFYILMFALPLLQFLFFYIYVNFNSFVIAFQKKTMIMGSLENGYEIVATAENFKKAVEFFFSADCGKMIWNSVQLLFCQLVIVTPLALLFSYYIAKEKAGSGFFRVMLYLPQVISVVVLGLLFQYIVGTVYPKVMAQYFDKEVIGFLLASSSYEQNFNAALIFTLWFSFGTNVLIYTGAMSSVDQSIVEAAQLDGVSSMQEFIFIYVPMIFSTVTTFVITGIAGIFNNQMNLHIFFANSDGNVDVFGYYFYRITAMNIASGGGASGNLMSLNELAALGLIATAILIPTTLLVRNLLNKYGPSAE